MMGVEVEVLKASWRRAVDPAAVEERLKRDKGHAIKAILVVQIDTASGVVNDIPAIRKAMDAAKHPALLMVDTRGLARLHAVRHGRLGHRRRHVGLAEGPDDAAGPRLRRRQRAGARDPHHRQPAHALLGLDLPRGRDPLPEILRHAAGASAVRPAQGASTCCWPKGLEHAFRRHALLAEATRLAVAKWAEGQVLAFSIPNPAERANSITCILMQGRDPQPLLDYCRDKCNVVLGVGLGDLTGKAFRIAHMGHCNAPMVLGTLGAVEMGLKALASRTARAACTPRSSTWGARWGPEASISDEVEVTRRGASAARGTSIQDQRIIQQQSLLLHFGTPAGCAVLSAAGTNQWRGRNATIRCSCFWTDDWRIGVQCAASVRRADVDSQPIPTDGGNDRAGAVPVLPLSQSCMP